MSGVRLAVFDCDGTLVDGQAAICDAMERAFTDADMEPPPRYDIRRIVGLSLPQAVRHLTPDASEGARARVVAGYKNAYRAARAAQTLEEPLYDGIAGVLRALHDEGWQLAVATGKSDRGLHHCLETHGLRDLFVSLQTADRHPSKPDPAMLIAAMTDAKATAADTVMIGDTSFDMEMAISAGVRAVGVAWGYHPSEELRAHGAQCVVDTMDELKAALA